MYLTHSELHRLLNECGEPVRTMLLVIACLGLPPQGSRVLTWPDLEIASTKPDEI
jgi:hypothetical protein